VRRFRTGAERDFMSSSVEMGMGAFERDGLVERIVRQPCITNKSKNRIA
jgi:hypothetical protein